MALADYKLCDACGAKTFYDAALEYDLDGPIIREPKPVGVGDWAVLCGACAVTVGGWRSRPVEHVEPVRVDGQPYAFALG